jgi:hypothetical protein
MQTSGTALLAVERCSLVRVWMLYLAAVRDDWREQEHRQKIIDTDPSLVRHCQSVGYRRSPGRLAFRVTRLIGWSRMSLWSTMVVNIQAHGSGGGWPPAALAARS